ncbi:MAG: hypothetical protein GWN58_36490, partial [Anaerolineae bacterium]|nr:hypothetical protein [Anaerolineae bacterium]
NGCWEVERRVEGFAKTKAGRRLLWKMVWQHTWWGGLWPQFIITDNCVSVCNRYVNFHFWSPRVWEWDWAIERYKCTNWFRWAVHTPPVTFSVNGYNRWGRRPQ